MKKDWSSFFNSEKRKQEEERAETARALIENGEDVNAKTKKGWTALMMAAQYGYTPTVKVLLDNGADIEDRTANTIEITALMIAAMRGHIDTVKVLIDNGADVNAKGNQGYTALGLAASQGHTEIVEMLKAAGATE